MIVDPDFFDHWRTRMVADMLGNDPMAPIYIMRLWAHCQNRKGDTFDIPTLGIKAICQFHGDAKVLEDALMSAEYMSRDGLTVTVIGWAEKNSTLIAAWGNGHKGGRPKKNPEATQTEPTENPEKTQGKPTGNPQVTQAKPIREEKRREEDEPPLSPLEGGKPAKRKSRVPVDFEPNDTAIDKAKQLGVDVGTELPKFIDYHTAKGSVMADWQAAFRTWLGNARPSKPVTVGQELKYGSDEYFEFHRKQSWWADAGFGSVWEAVSSRCNHKNFHLFRDGQKIKEAA